jgi:hypothetical protein
MSACNIARRPECSNWHARTTVMAQIIPARPAWESLTARLKRDRTPDAARVIGLNGAGVALCLNPVSPVVPRVPQAIPQHCPVLSQVGAAAAVPRPDNRAPLRCAQQGA